MDQSISTKKTNFQKYLVACRKYRREKCKIDLNIDRYNICTLLHAEKGRNKSHLLLAHFTGSFYSSSFFNLY